MEIDIHEGDSGYIIIPIEKVASLKKNGHSTIPLCSNPIEKLKQILAICFSSENTFQIEELYNKKFVNPHIEYLANYLKYYDPNSGFDVKTIIIENKYVSLSFLKDFSNYYSRGYNNISRYCKRFHFFDIDISEEDFENFITLESDPTLLDDEINLFNRYLGQVVIKPLPNSLIGATLIRCYDEYFKHLENKGLIPAGSYIDNNNKRREYNCLREYSTNLFGKNLKFKSLVFQEQDRAISACATVALWMSFHKVSPLFRTKLPAPSEITKSAGITNSKGRIVPSNGLDTGQIIKAIDNLSEDIISEIYAPTNFERVAVKRKVLNLKIIKPYKLKRYLYAYLKLSAPPLLGYNIIRLDGNHLVAITGYRKEKTNEDVTLSFPLENETKILTEADRIQRFFSHDDQLGPFSKVGFNHNGYSNYIKVNWRAEKKYNQAIAQLVAIPLTNSIRINYTTIESFAESMQIFLKEMTSDSRVDSIIWDIYLTKSNEYKEEFSKLPIDKNLKLKFLKISFPQYIWIAKTSFLTNNENFDHQRKLADFIFDATDTPRSMNLFELFYHDKAFLDSLRELFKNKREAILEKYSSHFRRPNFLNKIESTLNRHKDE